MPYGNRLNQLRIEFYIGIAQLSSNRLRPLTQRTQIKFVFENQVKLDFRLQLFLQNYRHFKQIWYQIKAHLM